MDTACPLCRDPPTRADRHSTKIRRWVAAQRPADHAQRAHPHYIWVGLFGSIFFTAAAWLQLEAAVNGDVADIILETTVRHLEPDRWNPRCGFTLRDGVTRTLAAGRNVERFSHK